MNVKRRNVAIGILFAGTAGVGGGVVGCNTNRGGPAVPELPAVLVVWGDPDPDNNETFSSIRDVNDLDDRFVVIGTNGAVQFNDQKVCNACEVEGSTILIDGAPRVNIRFGTGPDGGSERRPYLVSTDGYYIELVSQQDAILFQEEDVRFEEDDNLSDDLAVRVGTIPNPAQ